MLLRIPLIGHEAPWRFRDSERFSSWLRGETWRRAGGVHGVRLCSGDQVELFVRELRREVAALPGGRVILRRLSSEEGRELPSLEEELRNRAGVAPDLRDREWLELVGQEVSAVESIYVVDGQGLPETARRWCEPAAEVMSLLRKLHESAVVTALLLTETIGMPGGFDFTVGEPLPDLAWLHLPGATAWKAYVHRRLAWETGGNAALCFAWAERIHEGLREGDDNGLEAALNRQAEGSWAGIERSVVRGLKEFLLAITRRANGGMIDRRDLTRRLEQGSLLWRPQGSPRARVVPWVARACLLRRLVPEASLLLRAELSVPGIVGLAFSRCLDLEGCVRAGLHPAGEPREETWGLHERLGQGAGLAARCYSESFPMRPEGPWGVASLGEVLAASDGPGINREALSELRDLRNALGHGHPCNWPALMTLKRLEAELG